MKKLLCILLSIFMILGTSLIFTGCDEEFISDIADGIADDGNIDTQYPYASSSSDVTADSQYTASYNGDTDTTGIDKDGSYSSKEDVSLYIYTYGELPDNFITKKEAQALGWSGGSLEKYAPGKSIGGDRFGNYEKALPVKSGRTYTECDIDTVGASSRGAKRIVFSNDGLIYYTGDHYSTFELLYGEP